MKLFYRLLFLLVCFGFYSCKDWEKGKFEITNHTSTVIDSIYVTPDKLLGKNYISLKPNETKEYSTKMGSNGIDGVYEIHYKLNDTSQSAYFGYYSNGSFLEKEIKIDIQADTILFKFIR